MPAATTTQTRQQCRHIHASGRRCGSPCLRAEPFCYFHHTSRKPIARPLERRSRRSAFDLPHPEDRTAIQLSIGEILRRLASNDVDPRRAGLLLYGLQIASTNLSQGRHDTAPQTASDPVEDLTEDPTLGPLAPPADFSPAPPVDPRNSLLQTLLDTLDLDPTPTGPTPAPPDPVTPAIVPRIHAAQPLRRRRPQARRKVVRSGRRSQPAHSIRHRASLLTDLQQSARVNGWPLLLTRAAGSLRHRLRDRLTARRLHAPGFHVGHTPRLLGLSFLRIGPDFQAGDSLWLEAVWSYAGHRFTPTLTIGPHARLSDSVHIACLDRVTIGAHLLCGSGVLISDHSHGRYDGPPASDPAIPPAQRPLASKAPVLIGSNVWLSDGARILAGSAIGDGCIIGANAVVNGAIPPQTIAVGAPARPIRRWNAAAQAWQPLG